MEKLRGKALKKGDSIGICAPSGALSEGQSLEKVVIGIENLGFKPILGKSCYESYGYLAGNDDIRTEDLNSMFENPNVDGILCLRGGYGTPRIVDKIDYDIIRKNPKIFMGYSDITALLISINQNTGLVTFHGPMGASNVITNNDEEFTLNSFLKNLTCKKPFEYLENPKGREIVTYSSGKATGEIIGGNLSLLVSTLGSKYEIDTKGKILFIEEINEYTYRVDRMLTSLRLSGKFEDCAGIILGDFNACDNEKDGYSLSLHQVIKDVIGDLNKPVISNFSSGHCENMITIPFGVKCELDAESQKIKILEDSLL